MSSSANDSLTMSITESFRLLATSWVTSPNEMLLVSQPSVALHGAAETEPEAMVVQEVNGPLQSNRYAVRWPALPSPKSFIAAAIVKDADPSRLMAVPANVHL